MEGLVADASWLRDTFVPGYSFSERVVPLLLWVPSCPPSPLMLRGHLSCWRALLGMAQLGDEQSSGMSSARGSALPGHFGSGCWIPSSARVLWSFLGFSAPCSTAVPFGAPCRWLVPFLPRAGTQDLVPLHRVKRHLVGTRHPCPNPFQVRPHAFFGGCEHPTHPAAGPAGETQPAAP